MSVKIQRTFHLSQDNASVLPGFASGGLISITEPGRLAPIQEGWGSILRIQFHDVTEDSLVYAAQEGFVVFSDELADVILDWLEEHEGTFTDIVVHCAMGVSRSAAVALFISEVYELLNFNVKRAMCHNKLVYKVLWRRYCARKNIPVPFFAVDRSGDQANERRK
jgi:hypothetical protein